MCHRAAAGGRDPPETVTPPRLKTSNKWVERVLVMWVFSLLILNYRVNDGVGVGNKAPLGCFWGVESEAWGPQGG